MKCHVCGGEAEFHCCRCEEPVCDDCCVPNTYMNPVEETRCTICQDGIAARSCIDYDRECKRVEALETKRAERRKKMRENYFKPENVEKRRLRKIERRRLKEEQELKFMKAIAKAISSMFRGVF